MTKPTDSVSTARDRMLDALEANPEGLSKSELHRVADCNRGAFRRQLARLIDTGQVEVHREYRPLGGGETAVHTIGERLYPGGEPPVDVKSA